MERHSCCNKQKVKRGLWSPDEDEKLINYISTYGHGCWSSVPRLAGLQRCGKSCRLRWINYLRPDLKRGSFSPQEATLVIELHRLLGNRWAQIAKHLPGRTDNEVKNFWNSSIKKKLLSNGASAALATFHDIIANPSINTSYDHEAGFFSVNTNPNNLILNAEQDPPQLYLTTTPTPMLLQGLDHGDDHHCKFDYNNVDLVDLLPSSIIPPPQLDSSSYDPNIWPLGCYHHHHPPPHHHDQNQEADPMLSNIIEVDPCYVNGYGHKVVDPKLLVMPYEVQDSMVPMMPKLCEIPTQVKLNDCSNMPSSSPSHGHDVDSMVKLSCLPSGSSYPLDQLKSTNHVEYIDSYIMSGWPQPSSSSSSSP